MTPEGHETIENKGLHRNQDALICSGSAALVSELKALDGGH